LKRFPLGERAGDQGRRDHREHHLEAMYAVPGIVGGSQRLLADPVQAR